MLRKSPTQTSINQRLAYIKVAVFFVALALSARLFYVQIVKHTDYLKMAISQQQFSAVLLPGRGTVYFREDNTGNLISAATTQKGYTLYIDNRYFKNPENAFTALNAITPIDRNVFDEISKKKNDPYEALKQRVTLDEGDKIRALKLDGVGLSADSWRFYPGDKVGANFLGFVSKSKDNEEQTGKYGIEKYYESVLQGEGGNMTGEKDARGILLAIGGQIASMDRGGGDVVLTIDPSVQRAAENELKRLADAWHPVRGGIIIVEPKTGKIKAMSSFPSFNPNEYNKEKDLGVFLNPFVEKIFEFGSVFKPLTMAAAIDQGAVKPDTTYIDRGEVTINSKTIKNFDGKVRGVRTMTQVLEESLNTGAIFAMQKLGKEKFKEYFHNYGLGEKLNIDLPGELAGNLANLNDGREVYYATASFGQGVAVTPLELTMALSSLGNGGELLRPSLSESRSRTVIRRVLKPETSQTITTMLVDVVDKALLAGKAKKAGYSIAAKTGTAQILNTSGGSGYSGDKYLHSFFGYFPAYDPRFLIFMFIEQPQGVEYASHSLTDSFSALVDFLINYYTIPPDR